MTDLIEQVARAMCECSHGRDADDEHGGPHPDGLWLDRGEPWWTGYKSSAQAAIAIIVERCARIAESQECGTGCGDSIANIIRTLAGSENNGGV